MSNPYSENRTFSPTPKLIKTLMLINLSFGCLSGFFNSLLGAKLKISFLNLFALTFSGLKRGWLWQPFTFVFLPEIEGSLSFYFLFTLCFDIYLLWLIGCKVHNELGRKTTLRLFLFIPFCAGILCSLLGVATGLSCPLFGLSYAMIPLIVSYCFCNPGASFNFIPTQRLKIKWLGLGLILLYLFQDISELKVLALLTHLTIFAMSYLYMVIVQKKESPFPKTHRLDQFFIKRRRGQESSKIIHLYETYESHEHFINQTLDRIGQNQKVSLIDRLRLKWYSFKKRNRL